MKREQVKTVGVVGAGVAAAVAAWFFFLREPAPQPSAPTTEASASEASVSSGPLRWDWERERQGLLSLRGQVVNEAGEPVNDAVVVISTVPPTTTRTGADGRFSFDKLLGRTYELSARAGTMVGSDSRWRPGTTEPLVLQLRAGAAVAVLVQDEAKQPVRGAKLSLARQDEFGDRAPTALTGDDGKAILRGVERGWMVLEAEAPGFASASNTSKIEAALPDGGPSAEVILTLQRGVAVSGQVVDERGQPIAGARITFDAPHFRSWMGRGELAKTDGKGAFRFAALKPQQYTFRATDGEHVTSTSEPVQVGDQPVSGVRIIMKPGRAIVGSVVDDKGAPVPYVVVRSAPSPEHGAPPEFLKANAAASGSFTLRGLPLPTDSWTTSDGSGAFHFRGLPEGQFRIWADRRGAASAGADAKNSKLAKSGAPPLQLVLKPLGRILGKVVTTDGKTPALAEISLPDERPIITRDGSFVIDEVEPAEPDLLVRGPDFRDLKVSSVVVSAGQDTDLRALTVTRARRVTGTVIDAHKRPVVGARIEARGMFFSLSGEPPASLGEPSDHVRTTSDARGAFSLGGLSPAQTLQITAESPAGRSKEVSIEPGEGDPAPVTLQLRGPASGSGRATVNGKPGAK